MMPFSIFVSSLGITDLANKTKIYTNLMKLLHLKFISFCSSLKVLSLYVIIFGNYTRINIFIIARRKSDANMHVFYT